MQRILLFPLVFVASYCVAVQVPAQEVLPEHPKVKAPWFTGPLLAPSAITIPKGHVNIEPFIFAIANIGSYDNDWGVSGQKSFWNIVFQPDIQIGLSKRLDCAINPILQYNYSEHAGKWSMGDIPVQLDVQLYTHNDSLVQWNTALRLSLYANIPTGRYRNLSPEKNLSDGSGTGSWNPGIGLDWGNLFYLGKSRFLTWRNALVYNYSPSVKVKNLNVYGGGPGTDGTVYPGYSIKFDTAIEVNITRNWAFACDLVTNISGKTRFSGTSAVSNTSPFSIQFSMAPAIEYNLSAQLGIIAGSWFTLAGKNSAQFASAVIALNYFH